MKTSVSKWESRISKTPSGGGIFAREILDTQTGKRSLCIAYRGANTSADKDRSHSYLYIPVADLGALIAACNRALANEPLSLPPGSYAVTRDE